MRDVVLNVAVGWAAVATLIFIGGALGQTKKDILKAKSPRREAVKYLLMWAAMFALVYITGKGLRDWL